MLMDIWLSAFDIYQGTVALNSFKSNRNSWCPDFFKKKKKSDERFEVHLVPYNIASTGKYARALIKLVFRPEM